jgi:GGDEF domain-containing protein
VAHSGWITLAPPAISFLFYCALLGGVLLSWRFHTRRIFFALIVLFLSRQAVVFFGYSISGRPGWTGAEASSVLLSLDFVLIAMMKDRSLTVSSMAPFSLLLFVESVIAIVLCSSTPSSVPSHGHHGAAIVSLPAYVLLLIAAAAIFLLVRSVFVRKPVDSALFWSLAGFFLSLHFSSTRSATVYSAAAACVLASAIVENSYLLAYHDELTTLPSRRAFNDAMLHLQHPYAIAVVDIDHFKRFNDTYGHDTGDQVLRLVAGHLSRVTGGGHAYRCGGEEFNILFPGKTTSEIEDHLEQLRASIESAAFRLRSDDRRQAPRGPERRNEAMPRRARKGDAIRKLTQAKPDGALSVTVSIGVAGSKEPEAHPDTVLEVADKALYRAKDNGRNRVEIVTGRRQKTRTKAAGIA